MCTTGASAYYGTRPLKAAGLKLPEGVNENNIRLPDDLWMFGADGAGKIRQGYTESAEEKEEIPVRKDKWWKGFKPGKGAAKQPEADDSGQNVEYRKLPPGSLAERASYNPYTAKTQVY